MSNENEALPLEELFLPETLCKLGLTGQLEKKRMHHILSSWLCLKNLTQLYLMSSKLDESSFPSLVVLRSLCLITLYKAYDGRKLCFSSQSFPRLRELRIWCAPQLNQVEIEEDAMGNLVKLWFVECPELNRLPQGIEYLTILDELRLENTAVELTEIANECMEELMKISHIRKLIIISNGKNFRQRLVSREGTEFSD
jgi:disease resistance protein RPM1